MAGFRVFRAISTYPRLVCGGVGVLIALLAVGSGLAEVLDLQWANFLFRQVGTRFKPSPEIVLVVVDDASVEAMKAKAGPWPWPRSSLARLVEACKGAACIGIDIPLFESDPSRLQDDMQLSAVFRRQGNVALEGLFQNYRVRDGHGPEPAALQRSLIAAPVGRLEIPVHETLTRFMSPSPIFSEAANRIGHVNLFSARDYLVRSYPYWIGTDQGMLPSLAMATLLAARSEALLPGLRLFRAPELLANESRELVFYRESFTRHSAVEVLTPSASRLAPSWAADRVVLIGVNAGGFSETRATPISSRHSALELHATALSNCLQQTWVRSLSPVAGCLMACVFGLFPIFSWRESIRQTWLVGGLLLAGYYILAILAFHLVPLRLPASAPLLAFAGAAIFRLTDALVRERTSRRRLEDLREAQQMVSNMLLHDLNAPVNNMIMLLESVLPEQPVDSKARRRLENALAEGMRLSDLLQILLDIQRMETGRMPMKPRRFRWDQLVEEIVARLQPQAARRGLKIRSISAGMEIEIQGDHLILVRVLTNLLDNALQHATGGTTILCETLRDVPEQGWLTCRVANHGMLLESHEREKLFEPFNQIRRGGRDGEARGFGLGMAFCKLAVAAHGGRIHCRSPAPGWQDGVAFDFALPLGLTDRLRG